MGNPFLVKKCSLSATVIAENPACVWITFKHDRSNADCEYTRKTKKNNKEYEGCGVFKKSLHNFPKQIETERKDNRLKGE